MSTGHTDTLHLSLGADERTNRNWEILDAAVRRLGRGQIIPDDLLVQGVLEVTGDATIGGTLTAGTIQTGLLSASQLTAQSLTITDGPITLPPASLSTDALQPGVAVVTAGMGTPVAAVGPISPVGTPIKVCALTLPAAAAGHLLLLFAQLSIHFTTTGPGGAQSAVDLILRADTTDMQLRAIEQLTTGEVSLDVPLTMIRLESALVPTEWSIWAKTRVLNRFIVTITHGVIGAIQLR